MPMQLLLEFIFRSTLVLGTAWFMARILHRASADLRYCIWQAGLTIAALSALPVAAPVSMRIVIQGVPQIASVTEPFRSRFPWEFTPVWVWAGVCVLLVGRLTVDLLRLAGLTRRARLGDCGDVRFSDAVATAATWVVRHPVILLPTYMEQWSAEKRETVIQHERAHIARQDWIWQIAARVLTAVFWFQPLVWIAAGFLRREAEQATDDLVLARGVAATDYAQQLVDVARELRGGAPRLTVAMARTPVLSARIAAILDPSRHRTRVRGRTKVTIFAGSVLFLAVVAACQAERIYKVAEVTMPPRVGARIEPKYTEQARKGKIQGSVVLTLVVRPNGRADRVRVVKSLDRGLDANAIAAIRQWTFDPGKKDGKPVPVAANIQVNFRLQ